MSTPVPFELFKSDRGVFLAVSNGIALRKADTLVMSVSQRTLSAREGGEELDVKFPKLSTEMVVLLSGRNNVAAVEFAPGGITFGAVLALVVLQ